MRLKLLGAGLLVVTVFTCCPSLDRAEDQGKLPTPEVSTDDSSSRPNDDLAGVYAIICVKNLKCLDAPAGAADANGTRLQLWSPNRQENQRWEIRPVSGNRVKIVCATSGKVLDVESTQLRKQSAAVQLYDDLNGKNQLWELVPQGDGVFTIRSCACDRVLDAEGGALERDGCPVQAFGELDGDNQRWVLLKYLGVTPSVSVSDVRLEKETRPVEQSSQFVTIIPGAKVTFKESKKVEYGVNLSLHQGTELSLGSRARGAWGAVEAEVKAAVKARAEQEVGQAWRVSQTKEQTVEVDGAIIRSKKAKIAWIEHQRTGHAKVTFGGATHDVDFHFPESLELVVTPVEDAKDK